jgi:hypothetical protein
MAPPTAKPKKAARYGHGAIHTTGKLNRAATADSLAPGNRPRAVVKSAVPSRTIAVQAVQSAG